MNILRTIIKISGYLLIGLILFILIYEVFTGFGPRLVSKVLYAFIILFYLALGIPGYLVLRIKKNAPLKFWHYILFVINLFLSAYFIFVLLTFFDMVRLF